jgi:hypothetical protein
MVLLALAAATAMKMQVRVIKTKPNKPNQQSVMVVEGQRLLIPKCEGGQLKVVNHRRNDGKIAVVEVTCEY